MQAALPLPARPAVQYYVDLFLDRLPTIQGLVEHRFELVGQLTDIQIIAVNLSIRERRKLKARFGGRPSRKLKGVGYVRFPFPIGQIHKDKLHWHEAHGIGGRMFKVKRRLD
jgi:hypothetical protein